eukprot:CAMPEP_0117542350 /NCGR_PEP_ID=MMETSP0784-20121206/44500_1 /TAXON_ID=39447 /ORGANISM="" /LENGTH=126 /DNA_ID=CAMNT_0005339095 /DNA_START=237 /DNA_END=617 /DNA_ORIENTATION=+
MLKDLVFDPFVITEHGVVLFGLDLYVFKAPVHHVRLPQLEQLNAPWNLRKGHPQDDREFLRELHVCEEGMLGCKDGDEDVRECRQRAVDRKGCSPRLVVPALRRQRPPLPFGEVPQIDVDFADGAH